MGVQNNGAHTVRQHRRASMTDTTTQPTQPTQGTTVNNTPTILSIITQALDAYINDLVDKRFHERMAEIQIEMPNIEDFKTVAKEMIDERMERHTKSYDHDEYDEVIGKMKDVDFEDMEEAVKNALRNIL
jgi:hypothetical protein